MAPLLSTKNINVAEGQSTTANSLIASDFDQYPVTEFAFFDTSSGGGHFVEGNTIEPAGQWVYVSASNLNEISYIGGSTAASETLYAEAYDTITGWSNPTPLVATTTAAASSPTPTSQLASDILTAENDIQGQVNGGIPVPLAYHLTNTQSLTKKIANDVAAIQGGHPVYDSNGFIYKAGSLDTQQCVALVQGLDQNIHQPWSPGTQVDVNGVVSKLNPGTAIATFTDPSYNSNHAAIFLGGGSVQVPVTNGGAKAVPGFFVLDQFNIYNENPSQSASSPVSHPLDISKYEPAEVRFIALSDSAATQYHQIL